MMFSLHSYYHGRCFLTVKTPNVLDLFCGIGGLSLGLSRAGFHISGGIDNWQDAKSTYELNHAPQKCLLADISKVRTDEITKFFGISPEEIDLMVGGPPCQGFSSVGKRNAYDPRNQLWQHYLDLVNQIRPAYVLLENVEGILAMNRGGICKNIIKNFNLIGYQAKWKLLKSADYGVPQLRKRVIFFAWLNGIVEPSYPNPTTDNHVTVEEAIFDLPQLGSGESATKYTCMPLTEYQAARRGVATALHNHCAANHAPHLVELLGYIPDGGNRKSIPDRLQPKSGFHNSYARLASNMPALAVTSNMRKPSSARTTHPKQSRGLTAREGLRLQSFDDSFEVLGSRTSQYLQVGNAVPPLLGEVLGKALIIAYQANTDRRIVTARKQASASSNSLQSNQLAFFF